ncbi:hypothetical protein HYW66_01200 [Candidatus Microgenomates bacterium]|nr:hypothetical protein [Candidatus Microgenomates bacterium]
MDFSIQFNNDYQLASEVEEGLMRSITGHGKKKSTLSWGEPKIKRLANRGKEVVSRGAETVALIPREAVRELKEGERIRAVRAGLKKVPRVAEGAVLKSRESRLATTEENRQKGIVQRTFNTALGRWVLKPIAESIPSPVFYGPGDIITGVSALVGRDILTGDRLDVVDRILYGVATAIPGVPSAVLIVPAKLIRRGGEDFVHARKQGDAGGMRKGAQDLKEGITGVRKALGDSKDTKPAA